MDERTKFIGRLLGGEKMAPLCREFGITRRTGYKIWERYQQDGNTGLYNRSRAPHRHPNQTPFEVEKLIVRLKTDKPSWGAPKIREIIINKYPSIKGTFRGHPGLLNQFGPRTPDRSKMGSQIFKF
jgi:putative transposase